jgi:hypothetical protein
MEPLASSLLRFALKILQIAYVARSATTARRIIVVFITFFVKKSYKKLQTQYAARKQ